MLFNSVANTSLSLSQNINFCEMVSFENGVLLLFTYLYVECIFYNSLYNRVEQMFNSASE